MTDQVTNYERDAVERDHARGSLLGAVVDFDRIHGVEPKPEHRALCETGEVDAALVILFADYLDEALDVVMPRNMAPVMQRHINAWLRNVVAGSPADEDEQRWLDALRAWKERWRDA